MTRIFSWNVQNGKGIDGKVSLPRIAQVIADHGGADVICLQELSRGLAWAPGGLNGADQIAELQQLFPNYEIVFGAAVDAMAADAQTRWQFGNATLSRLPVLSTQCHPLPKPAAGKVRNMARQATDVVVMTPDGALRIVNTHLEFHSQLQRLAQIGRLRELQQEALSDYHKPSPADADGPYQRIAKPVEAVFCGDFNMLVDSQEYRALMAPFTDDGDTFVDAWPALHKDQPHAPTCGIYDHEQWPEGAHCRDFFFVIGNCSLRQIDVDTRTAASDHQPLWLQVTVGEPWVP